MDTTRRAFLLGAAAVAVTPVLPDVTVQAAGPVDPWPARAMFGDSIMYSDGIHVSANAAHVVYCHGTNDVIGGVSKAQAMEHFRKMRNQMESAGYSVSVSTPGKGAWKMVTHSPRVPA